MSKKYFQNEQWEENEMEFFPKRKVSNKLSWKIHHIAGSFYSNKMKRIIEYESMGECLFYFFLELATEVERYYVQPLEIEVPFLTKEGDRKSWIHVPDVLVFVNGFKSTLFQIKESPQESKKHVLINKICKKYSAQRQWEYKVIYPKKLPQNILYNIKFLQGAIRKRKRFDEWIPEIIYRVEHMKGVTIDELASSFSPKVNPLLILPAIYHLIATGILQINITKEIDQYSEVRLKKLNEELLPYLNLDGDLFEYK
ncbi:hypothetical protein CD30_17405 [Ureibacillus massiliensis 4400831 = CIP 108448 = CCUG 49529]|uniref:Uncharacterized protein n=1 Tax=Ureibacillus massiliensis 4400831 = CIP 108448 = CCUG 49529 TaxID=1211035 RepID=A0A0A3JQL5_9BACL|nr:TnsA endonuclease C-terminal domain-containing protein [Ureibacillus massiliensis]KGR89282.1 hypothetical protein CD30_17405 [Ureibacillus massiliensis 4400831 = CIP 108448 = CCUG 49529]